MTQDEKDLLIKDPCARLPYGVKCADFRYDEDGNRINTINILEAIFPNRQTYKYEGILSTHHISRIKPYLRPMSSMTKKEQGEFVKFHCVNLCPIVITDLLSIENEAKMIDWLNAHQFDYRKTSDGKTMIEAGLAREASEDMYEH